MRVTRSGAHEEQHGHGLWVVFPGREAKAAYMAEASAEDAQDPAVIAWASQFMRLPPEQRAAAILRFCQLAVRYQRDPAWFDRGGHRHGVEVLESSAVVLFRGYGDCDAKTRLFLALCKVCGVPARLAPVFRGVDGFPHVRAEVLDEQTGQWRIADPSIANSGIGRLPLHNRTHLLQRRWGARGWEVSDDDGNSWHPMEGSHDAGAEEIEEDADPSPEERDAPPPGEAAPSASTPAPAPVVRVSRRWRYRPNAVITILASGGKLAQRWRVGRDGITLTAVGPATRATAESIMAAAADKRAAKPIRGARRAHVVNAHAGPSSGPYKPGAIVFIGGRWYQIDAQGRATQQGILADQPPPPPPDQIAAILAAARRVAHMPPPRRPARPRHGPLPRSAPGAAPPASMLPSQVPQIIAAVPKVISAVGHGISGVTSAVQSIAGAFSGFGGGVGEAGDAESETAIPGISAIVSALGVMAYRLEDFILNSGGEVHPSPAQADAWLRAFRIDPGLLFVASSASVEDAARVIRYLKLASGEQPMVRGWRLGEQPYLARVDAADPLTDPGYLQGIREAIVGTRDARAAVKHLEVAPVIMTRETARRMLALLRHELVASGLPHWAEVRGRLGGIESEVRRLREVAGEVGVDAYRWLREWTPPSRSCLAHVL